MSIPLSAKDAQENNISKRNKSVINYDQIKKQKKSDAECLSAFSQVINCVRSTKGRALDENTVTSKKSKQSTVFKERKSIDPPIGLVIQPGQGEKSFKIQ